MWELQQEILEATLCYEAIGHDLSCDLERVRVRSLQIGTPMILGGAELTIDSKDKDKDDIPSQGFFPFLIENIEGRN